jgi:hypothetical protein
VTNVIKAIRGQGPFGSWNEVRGPGPHEYRYKLPAGGQGQDFSFTLAVRSHVSHPGGSLLRTLVLPILLFHDSHSSGAGNHSTL